MARPLRIERPGAGYHVTGRGLERRRIFPDDRDRRHWLELLEEAVPTWRLRVYAYVLMDNHHHLMLETREASLGRAMHWLNTNYTTWFNPLHQWAGPRLGPRPDAVSGTAQRGDAVGGTRAGGRGNGLRGSQRRRAKTVQAVKAGCNHETSRQIIES